MLKKMRWRFIGAAMAAFSAVVVLILCTIGIWNYSAMLSQQDDMLQELLVLENRTAPAPPGAPPDRLGKFSPEVRYSLRFFSVRFREDGSLLGVNQANIASISREEAQSYAQAVLETGNTRGFHQGYRYLVHAEGGETEVLFLNCERELSAQKNLLFICAAIAVGSLGAVFLLVVLFSGRAILPYARNLTAQKQFITNASHELKTPLTAISTSADVLAMEQPGDEWVENIRVQAARLSKLVGNLVTLSRLDEENPFPEKILFSLSDAVWETAQPFSSLAQAKGLRYTQSIQEHVNFTGDKAAFQQLVSILLDNAVKYTPNNGCIALTLTGKALTITNTCAPGETTDVSRLFERFYRPDESHNRSTGGTGLGLAIAKATADAQGVQLTACREADAIAFSLRL